MNWKDYCQAAQRTLVDLGNDKLDLSHMILGMISEYNEYQDAVAYIDNVNRNEEVGDIYWYVGNYCNIQNITPILNNNIGYEGYAYCLSKLSNIVKRYVAYNVDIDKLEEEYWINGILYNLNTMYVDTTMEQVLEKNINKLKVRFPDKFDIDKVLNRDLSSEYKTLL